VGSIILPHKWRSQPKYSVRIAAEYAEKCFAAINVAAPLNCSRNGFLLTRSFTPTASRLGIGFAFSGYQAISSPALLPIELDEFTSLAVIEAQAAVDTSNPEGIWYYGKNFLRRDTYNDRNIRGYVYYSPDYNGDSGTGYYNVPSSGTLVVAHVYKRNARHELWVNGQLITSATPGNYAANFRDGTNNVSLGGSSPSSRMMSPAGGVFWTTALTPSVLSRFKSVEDFWQIFETLPRRIWVPSAGGGATNYDLNAESSSYSVSGVASSLFVDRKINLGSGSYSLIGSSATVNYDRLVNAATGSYSLSGSDVTFTYAQANSLNAENGGYSVTGASATLLRTYYANLASSSYSITGNNATTQRGFSLDSSFGIYSVTGSANAFLYNRVLSQTSGSYLLTGLDVTFLYSGATGYELVCDSESYAVIGFDLSMLITGLWTDVVQSSDIWTNISVTSTTWIDR
jgi:hypothetical protein